MRQLLVDTAWLESEAEAQVTEFESQYLDGFITQGEKYNKVIDVWSRCSDVVAEEMMKSISTIESGKPVNSVWMMAHSQRRPQSILYFSDTTCSKKRVYSHDTRQFFGGIAKPFTHFCKRNTNYRKGK